MATPRRPCSASPDCRWSTTSMCSSAASASGTATPRWLGSVLPTTEPDKKVVPLDLFPDGPHRQRAGQQVVFAGSVGGVRGRPRPDRADEAPGAAGRRLLVRLELLLDRYRQEHSAQSAGQPRRVGLRRRRARAAGRDSRATRLSARASTRRTSDIRRTQITEFGRTLGQPVAPVAKDGTTGSELERNVRQPVRQRLGVVASVTHSYKEQFVEEDRRFFRIAERGRARGHERLSHADRHPEGAARDRRQPRLQFTPNQRLSLENFYTHSGRDEGRFFQGDNLDNAREYQNYRLQFIEEGLMSNAVGGEHFFQSLVQQPRRLARELRARHARRARPARDAVRAAVEARRHERVGHPFTYADESQSGFRMFNELNDDTVDASVNWSTFEHGRRAGRRSTSSASITSTATRDFDSRRFHFIPITTQKADAGNLLFNPAPAAGGAVRVEQHRHGVPLQRGDATGRRATTGDQTTTSGYGMVDMAMTEPHSPDWRAHASSVSIRR